MPYDTLLYEKKARIGYVTLNRPRLLNAQSPEMFEELAQVFGDIKHDPEVGVVILTGAGDRAFCAGADINFLKQLAQTTPMAAKTFVEKNRRAFGAIAYLGKPVIAAVNGFALGGDCQRSRRGLGSKRADLQHLRARERRHHDVPHVTEGAGRAGGRGDPRGGGVGRGGGRGAGEPEKDGRAREGDREPSKGCHVRSPFSKRARRTGKGRRIRRAPTSGANGPRFSC